MEAKRDKLETASKVGTLGWLGLALYVGVWDKLAPETLTSAYKRGKEHPIMKPLVIGGLGVTALHLLEAIPRECDPFYGFKDNRKEDYGR